MALFAEDRHGGARSVSVYRLSQNVLQRVTPDGLAGQTWSPDGKALAVNGGIGRTLDIYRTPSDGGGEPQPILRNASPKYAIDWTRDGKTLIYMQFGDPQTREDIWMMDVESGQARPIVRTAASELGGRLSPDEKWLAYVAFEDGRYEVFVTPFPAGGSRWRVSSNGAREPLWSRDGRELFYRNGREMLSVTVRPGPSFEWDPPRKLFEGQYALFYGAGNPQFDVSLDGRRFLMMEEVNTGSPRLNVLQDWRQALGK